jgi:hypothetical protein
MKHIFFLAAAAFLLFACQKELSRSAPVKTGPVSLAQFFTKNAVPVYLFTAASENSIRLTTPKGTGVQFPENAFVTSGNRPVTGPVSIEVKEIFTPGEMILNNTPAMSDGKPLISGGEFFVRVTQGSEVLKLAPGKHIRLNVVPPAGADMQGMQVFNGDTSSGTINWIPNNNPGNTVARDTIRFSVILFADSLQWLNIDKFIDEPKIRYTVLPGNCPDLDSTAVFVHLTGQKSVFRFPGGASGLTSDNMIAARATLVGICVVDGKIHQSVVPVNMQNGGVATLAFTPIEEAALKQKLAALE